MAPSKKKDQKRTPRLGKGLSSLMARPVSVDPVNTIPQPMQSAAQLPEPTPAAKPSQAAVAVEDPPAEVVEAGGATPSSTDSNEPGLTYLALDVIAANPNQPRKDFNEHRLEQLAESIRSAGLMQPIVVRPNGQGDGQVQYEVVAGERRWRAARIAGLEQVPAIVRELDEEQVAEWALIENLQREDLNAIERAQAFANLIEQFKLSHQQVAEKVGIERPTVSNSLRLLALHVSVQQLVIDNLLSAGQARAIAALEDHEKQMLLAKQAVAKAWSVREVEKAVRRMQDGQGDAKSDNPSKADGRRSAHLDDLEQQLGQQLNTRVKIRPGRKKGSGTLMIEFYSLDQFDDLLTRLGVSAD